MCARSFLAILIVAALFVLPACSRKSAEGGNLVSVSSKDDAMNGAIAKAKETSGEFVLAFHAQKPGTKEFFVKKPYSTPSGSQEHMWIEVSAETNGVIEGTIANVAEETREAKMGQKVSLKLAEISDWKYLDGNKLIGGYTVRYFIERMPAKEREAFLKHAGFEL